MIVHKMTKENRDNMHTCKSLTDILKCHKQDLVLMQNKMKNRRKLI